MIWSGIVGMILLILFSYMSFIWFDLGSAVTGGLITNLGASLASLGTALGGIAGDEMAGLMAIIPIIGGAFMGVGMIVVFPLDWVIIYRPDEPMMVIAIILPWILTCTAASAISAHSPKGGFTTSIAIGIGYMIPAILIYLIVPMILGSLLGLGDASFVTGILDGLFTGLTDRSFILSVISATMEGALIGGIFGAFIGSLKYKPELGSGKSKKSKSYEPIGSTQTPYEEKKEKSKKAAPASADASNFCIHCGAKMSPTEKFCTNCGAAT